MDSSLSNSLKLRASHTSRALGSAPTTCLIATNIISPSDAEWQHCSDTTWKWIVSRQEIDISFLRSKLRLQPLWHETTIPNNYEDRIPILKLDKTQVYDTLRERICQLWIVVSARLGRLAFWTGYPPPNVQQSSINRRKIEPKQLDPWLASSQKHEPTNVCGSGL